MELTAAEGRVLGCLIEREAIDPDAYPVTLNALRLACNQSTERDPVVAYDDRTVEDSLLALKSKGLARFTPPGKGERTTRYSHRADDRWRMAGAELAVLSVLLVGGVQTVSEVRSRARRRRSRPASSVARATARPDGRRCSRAGRPRSTMRHPARPPDRPPPRFRRSPQWCAPTWPRRPTASWWNGSPPWSSGWPPRSKGRRTRAATGVHAPSRPLRRLPATAANSRPSSR